MAWFHATAKKEEVINYNLPSEDWWDKDVPEYTPDVAYLSQLTHHRVFVCDELMRGRFKHELLQQRPEDFRLIGLTNQRFSLIQRNLGKMSTVIPIQETFAQAPYCRIRGELFKVPTEALYQLDSYKENGVQFERIRARVLIPSRDKVHEVGSWMYVGKSDKWKDVLTQGLYQYDNWSPRKRIRYLRDAGGDFQPVIVNRLYRPVSTFIPKNKKLDEYYYFSTFHNIFPDS